MTNKSAPHIRAGRTTLGVMGDAVAALGFLYAMAIYYHGPRAAVLGLLGVAVACICDGACALIRSSRPNIRDFSPVVTGLILPLMMPASISYSIVAVACVFAIVVAKAPFGGVGHNVFNPAAAGFSFVAFVFGEALFTYPPPDMILPVWGEITFSAPPSPAFIMMLGGQPGHGVLDMLLGNYPGPMGATNILILTACLLYLVLRGTVNPLLPVSFFGSVAVVAYFFPRGVATGTASVGLELATGMVLFGGIFLLTDPVTTPGRRLAKILYGVIAGVVVMLFRHHGNMEEQITYAILLMNTMVYTLDLTTEHLAQKLRRYRRARLGLG